MSTAYGGKPYINEYIFQLSKTKNCIKQAYFNKLEYASLDYVARNLVDELPDNCPFKNQMKTPKELCHMCREDHCQWNAYYIEAILSECGADYNLDNILLDMLENKEDEDTALVKINSALRRLGSEIRIQMLLRREVFKYLSFYKVEEVSPERIRELKDEV